MEQFLQGNLIKELRKQTGLKQAELCDGICDKFTLSRIENGHQTPDYHVYTHLMERLGEDPHKYFSGIVTMEDKKFMDLDDQLTDLLRQKTEDAYKKAGELIKKNEKAAKGKSKRYEQLLLFHKATLAFQKRQYQEAYDLAINAMLVTKAKFDLETVSLGIYTSTEVELVNIIASALYFLKTPADSTDIYEQLKVSLDKNYRADITKQKVYLLILYNITVNLGEQEEYEKGIPYCEQGIELSTEMRNSHYLSLFLFNLAYCKLQMKEIGDGLLIMSKAFSMFYATKNYSVIEQIKAYLENNFNLSLNDINPIVLYEKSVAKAKQGQS